MPYVHRTTAWRHVRPWLSAAAGVALMLVALAGPAAAQGSSATLRDASVWPRIARPSTPIRFAVTFQDAERRPAVGARVVIDGHSWPMSLAGLGETGARYAFTMKLRTGRHWIGFEATGLDGTRATADGGTVWIKAAADLPTTGTGSSKPGTTLEAPSSGRAPTRPGAGTDGAGGADAGARVEPPHTSKPSDEVPPESGSGTPHDSPGTPDDTTTTSPTSTTPTTDDTAATTDPGSAGSIGPDAADTTTPDAEPSPGLAAALALVGPPGTAGGGGSGGLTTPHGLGVLGLGADPFDGFLRVYPVLITTSGTAVVWAAFIIFGKRRRDGEPPAPDAVLASQAASAMEPIPAVELIPPPRQLPPGVDLEEADLPRWRRPSLLLARKTDPLRTASVAVSLSFEGAGGGAAGLADGGERRQIRYRLVRLLDLPDESTGRELGILDAGDEVEIVEAYGIYRLVVCPDGQRGWLHKMVLGDLIGQDQTGEPAPDGIDEDVLAAFLAARRQTA